MSTSRDFDVRSETMPGGAEAVYVIGDLDLATAPLLEERLAATAATVVAIDLSGCTFLDSAGIRALVSAARELSDGGRSLRVVTDDSGIRRLLEITGVDTVIDVHRSLDDAI